MDYLVDNLKGSLYLEKEESVPVYELLSVVAAQYNMTAEHYCEASDAMDWAALGNRGSPGAVLVFVCVIGVFFCDAVHGVVCWVIGGFFCDAVHGVVCWRCTFDGVLMWYRSNCTSTF